MGRDKMERAGVLKQGFHTGLLKSSKEPRITLCRRRMRRGKGVRLKGAVKGT